MNGQWLGIKYGTSEYTRDGNLIVNLDRVGENYEGFAYNWPLQPPFICGTIPIRVPTNQNPFATESVLLAYTTQTDVPFPFVDASVYVSQIAKSPQSVARRVYIEGDWNSDRMRLSYTTDLGDSGHAITRRMALGQQSRVIGKRTTWKELKSEFLGTSYRKFIFRGQSNANWPLRSLYHREGRANLYRYTGEDVPMMHKRLGGQLGQPMNINLNDDRGGFVHLLQHHGYPTPLLDWSFSPFVAAFFAFRSHRRSPDGNDQCTRIFRFNLAAWTKLIEPILMLATPRNNFSFLEFPTQNNPRVIPQQALSAVTSVDDIENYVQTQEQLRGESFLDAFDIPVSEADTVMADLRLMGVTAGSLFPGIDGACEEMRAWRFPFE
jgi:hypothetical protein